MYIQQKRKYIDWVVLDRWKEDKKEKRKERREKESGYCKGYLKNFTLQWKSRGKKKTIQKRMAWRSERKLYFTLLYVLPVKLVLPIDPDTVNVSESTR